MATPVTAADVAVDNKVVAGSDGVEVATWKDAMLWTCLRLYSNQ